MEHSKETLLEELIKSAKIITECLEITDNPIKDYERLCTLLFVDARSRRPSKHDGQYGFCFDNVGKTTS